jgi:hypothetical protein
MKGSKMEAWKVGKSYIILDFERCVGIKLEPPVSGGGCDVVETFCGSSFDEICERLKESEKEGQASQTSFLETLVVVGLSEEAINTRMEWISSKVGKWSPCLSKHYPDQELFDVFEANVQVEVDVYKVPTIVKPEYFKVRHYKDIKAEKPKVKRRD